MYQLIIQVAIASYDQAVDDQMRLEVVNNDGQTMAGCLGNGKTFSGRQTRQTRMSTSTSTNGDGFDGFTYVSGFTLKKLKHIPKGKLFEDFKFDVIYNEWFNNNNNNNNNNPDKITLESIATESSPGLFVINTDVTILPSQILAIDKGEYVTTIHNFTNNGSFTNEGTFCTAKNFTNNTNANFNNNGGTTLNYLGGIFINNGIIENKGGKLINLQSTYNLNTPGILIGEPVLIIQ
jgi:hypothetical protein